MSIKTSLKILGLLLPLFRKSTLLIRFLNQNIQKRQDTSLSTLMNQNLSNLASFIMRKQIDNLLNPKRQLKLGHKLRLKRQKRAETHPD